MEKNQKRNLSNLQDEEGMMMVFKEPSQQRKKKEQTVMMDINPKVQRQMDVFVYLCHF